MEKNLNAPANKENARNNNQTVTVPPVPTSADAATAGKKQAIPEAAKKLKKEGNGNLTSGVITGAATGVGALVGAVAGSFAANAINRHGSDEINPDDIIVTPESDDDDVQVTVVERPDGPTTTVTVTVEQGNRPEPAPAPVPEPEPEPAREIEVLGYEHINTEDGSEMDLVVLSVDGTEVGIVDVDMDGRADVMLADVNGDGVIDENEVVPIEGVDIAMVDLINAAPGADPMTPGEPQYAQADLDYTNDANVDMYFA